jgi:hypothetical protein
MDQRKLWEIVSIASFLSIKLKIANEKKCNEIPNLILNETKVPHA